MNGIILFICTLFVALFLAAGMNSFVVWAKLVPLQYIPPYKMKVAVSDVAPAPG